jgi:hypothetical protein
MGFLAVEILERASKANCFTAPCLAETLRAIRAGIAKPPALPVDKDCDKWAAHYRELRRGWLATGGDVAFTKALDEFFRALGNPAWAERAFFTPPGSRLEKLKELTAVHSVAADRVRAEQLANGELFEPGEKPVAEILRVLVPVGKNADRYLKLCGRVLSGEVADEKMKDSCKSYFSDSPASFRNAESARGACRSVRAVLVTGRASRSRMGFAFSVGKTSFPSAAGRARETIPALSRLRFRRGSGRTPGRRGTGFG